MQRVILSAVLAATLMIAVPVYAHCGKVHPDGKDKTQTSRPLPKPE